MVELEKYILENYLERIVNIDEEGRKYIKEKDFNDLSLNNDEKRLFLSIMKSNKIEMKKELVEKKDRSTKVSEFNYGEKETLGLSDRDVPRFAKIEYSDTGTVIQEDYSELDRYIEKDFIPNNVIMTCKKRDKNKDLIGIKTRKDGRNMRQYARELYPTIQLKQILALKLSDKEIAHVINYLSKANFIIRGKDPVISMEFEEIEYYNTYKNFPLPKPLSKEENLELFKEYSATKDKAIKEKLILGNLRLVDYIAWQYSKYYNDNIDEIESYGCEGLMQSIDRFDYTKGHAFSSYAVPYIRGYILSRRGEIDGIKRGIWATLFYKCKSIVEQENFQTLSENPDLAVEINELMFIEFEERLAKGQEIPFNPAKNNSFSEWQKNYNLVRITTFFSEKVEDLYDEEDIKIDNLIDYDSALANESKIFNDQLAENINKIINSALSETEKKVISLRCGFVDGEEKTLEQVGIILNLRVERVRQIEIRALRKLRNPSYARNLKPFLCEEGVHKNLSNNQKSVSVLNPQEALFQNSVENTTIDDENQNIRHILTPEEFAIFSKEWEEATSKLKRHYKLRR